MKHTAQIIDLNARRQSTKFMPVKADMTPQQYGQRQLMEQGGWAFKKVVKNGDVVVTFGEPTVKMAFIEPTGTVQSYDMTQEG